MEDHEPGTPGVGAPHAASEPEPGKQAATRSQNVVHYVDRDFGEAARIVAGLLDRGGQAGSTSLLLVIVPSADDAIALNEALVASRAPGETALTPVTSVARGRRLLAGGVAALAASPIELSQLVSESLVPMASVGSCVIVWPEEILPDERQAALDVVLAELPRGAERMAIAAGRSADLDRFLERAMWRSRVVDHGRAAGTLSGVTVRVIAAGVAERIRALRAVLDALDPPRTVLVAAGADGEASARNAATILGGRIEVSQGVPEGRCNLAVVFDDVVTTGGGALASLAGVADEVVAIIRPAHVAILRKAGAEVLPFTWSGAAAAARSAQDLLRDEIRGTVVAGAHAPWILAIEPLLGEMDPVEVAAAAGALLDRERRRSRRLAESVQAAGQATQRDVPVRREVPSRPGAGFVPREREGGSRREGPSGRAGGRPAGGGFRDREGGERGRRGRDEAPSRPFRGRGDRPGAGRGERPAGGRGEKDRGFRGPERRPPRDGSRDRRGGGDDIERMPRAAREGAEWSERGERLRNSRRRPPGGTEGTGG